MSHINAIRLPADHPYYTVQRYNEEHGTNFTYWPGGDAAPDDWDGGSLLGATGEVYSATCRWHWIFSGRNGGDIIGYTKHAEFSALPDIAADNDADYVSVKRITEAEWEAADRPFSIVWAKSVGIIREETLLEQFEREMGSDYDAHERSIAHQAIEWMERRGG